MKYMKLVFFFFCLPLFSLTKEWECESHFHKVSSFHSLLNHGIGIQETIPSPTTPKMEKGKLMPTSNPLIHMNRKLFHLFIFSNGASKFFLMKQPRTIYRWKNKGIT